MGLVFCQLCSDFLCQYGPSANQTKYCHHLDRLVVFFYVSSSYCHEVGSSALRRSVVSQSAIQRGLWSYMQYFHRFVRSVASFVVSVSFSRVFHGKGFNGVVYFAPGARSATYVAEMVKEV